TSVLAREIAVALDNQQVLVINTARFRTHIVRPTHYDWLLTIWIDNDHLAVHHREGTWQLEDLFFPVGEWSGDFGRQYYICIRINSVPPVEERDRIFRCAGILIEDTLDIKVGVIMLAARRSEVNDVVEKSAPGPGIEHQE